METEMKMETKMETEMKTETEMETKTPLSEVERETKMEAKTETEIETQSEPETETKMEAEMENEKSAVSQLPLPQFIVMNEMNHAYGNGYVHYPDSGFTSIAFGQVGVFSPRAKIEVERSKSNPNSGHVHLRFCHSNRYWHQRQVRVEIGADLTYPVEDVTNKLCTLFSFVRDGTDKDGMPVFALVHVQTGRKCGFASGTFSVASHIQNQARLRITDWSTLINLPPHVAFKGYNDKYLRAVIQDSKYNYHKFESDDPNEKQCGYEVHPMHDGYVRIRSDHWGMFWRRSPNWIWGDGAANAITDKDTLFWPVLADNNNTIGLRNAGNNMFCMALTADKKVDCLNAGASTTTNPARLVVEELVSDRKIYNIRYRMEHSRIYDETPYVAGSSSLTNDTDQEASMGVEIEYNNEISNSFSNSITVTAGMSNTFEGGIPWIFSGKIEVYMEGSYTREWGQTVTTSQTVKATGSVVVPPRSVALVTYVGAKGTCNVPFSYTQQDRSSTNGAISNTEKIDGTFEGVNSYNFQFVMTPIRSL